MKATKRGAIAPRFVYVAPLFFALRLVQAARSIESDPIDLQDEKRGLIYATRVKLSKNAMNIEGKRVKLTPGMAVTVEIKTGQRRIIEYFLSPLIQYASEGLRER